MNPMPFLPMSASRRNAIRAALGLAAAGVVHRAVASAPPVLRSLQLVVPTPPGSQPDLIARWLVEPMAQRIGVAGIVVNRPGAAGAIAADAVLAAAPDSGSLLLGGLDHVAYSHLNSNRRPLDPLVDFAPVGAVNRDTWVVAAGADGPVKTLPDLVERARREGGLNYASTGEGSTAHLLSARLARALGIDAVHVPYRDPWLPDLIAGRVQFVVAPTPALLGAVRGGRVSPLATLTDERLATLGDVPTIRELGHADQVFSGGLFLFAPAALAGHSARLNVALRETVAMPEVAQRYRDAAIEPVPLAPPEVADAIRQRLQLVDAMRLAVFGRTR
jgi:tripartite-type tricarboxylate transporter receptor subunit TctC